MTQLISFDLAGISVSTGAACSSGTVKPSKGLQALTAANPAHLDWVLRVSLGPETNDEDVDHFIETWQNIFTHNAAAATA